ncbi:M10 family metallopeptidase C-terminal domain-containing protein [Aestuariivirga sp.]|uniref:M10 family metallopeptidase C-terminal domain-containing protein n=1 Tax=Aestuariivirga sp. TaxID=2650926 RepID=UPI0039E2C9D6
MVAVTKIAQVDTGVLTSVTVTASGITGTSGNDLFYGTSGNDDIYGGDGSDTFFTSGGNDIFDGGNGADTVNYMGRGFGNIFAPGYGVSVNLGFGTMFSLDPNSTKHDTLSNIENVVGTRYGDVLQGDEGGNILDGQGGSDYLFGWGGTDYLYGGAGRDFLYGGDGADTLSGGLGNDVLNGNDGIDTADYGYATQGMFVSLLNGNSSLISDASIDVDSLYGIENVTGSTSSDFLQGDNGANTLDGGDGNDSLSGWNGNDWLMGGNGNDFLEGGAGADYMNGGFGIDTAIYLDSGSGVSIDLNSGHGSGGYAEGDYLSLIENVQGSLYADTLTGNAIANTLSGFDGDDKLLGGGGDDVLDGGRGADMLDGGAGIDTASYASAGAVTVSLATGKGTAGDAAGDKLSNIENLTGSVASDSLTGDNKDNRLDGGYGDDLLKGGGGNDTLIGGPGSDTMTGGSGDDTFVFSSIYDSNPSPDYITDFTQGDDRIDLHAIDAMGGTGPDDAFTFIGNGAFSGVAGQLHYTTSGNSTYISGDINGDSVADFQIVLNTSVHLNAGDFIL